MVYKSRQLFPPFCHNSRMWQTDSQTYGRTDRILVARPRLHCMQRGNKTGTGTQMTKSTFTCQLSICSNLGAVRHLWFDRKWLLKIHRLRTLCTQGPNFSKIRHPRLSYCNQFYVAFFTRGRFCRSNSQSRVYRYRIKPNLKRTQNIHQIRSSLSKISFAIY